MFLSIAIFRIFSERSVAVTFRGRFGAEFSLKIIGVEPESKISHSAPLYSLDILSIFDNYVTPFYRTSVSYSRFELIFSNKIEKICLSKEV